MPCRANLAPAGPGCTRPPSTAPLSRMSWGRRVNTWTGKCSQPKRQHKPIRDNTVSKMLTENTLHLKKRPLSVFRLCLSVESVYPTCSPCWAPSHHYYYFFSSSKSIDWIWLPQPFPWVPQHRDNRPCYKSSYFNWTSASSDFPSLLRSWAFSFHMPLQLKLCEIYFDFTPRPQNYISLSFALAISWGTTSFPPKSNCISQSQASSELSRFCAVLLIFSPPWTNVIASRLTFQPFLRHHSIFFLEQCPCP